MHRRAPERLKPAPGQLWPRAARLEALLTASPQGKIHELVATRNTHAELWLLISPR
jgi:hypothetical protein